MQERLELIFEKIRKLIELNNQLSADNTKLKSELNLSRDVQSRLKNDLGKMIAEKETAENNLNFNTLAVDNLTKEELKDKIDQYISEIDNCIAQIEKL